MPPDELHERFEPLPDVRGATLARSTKKREQTTSTLSGFVIHEHLATLALPFAAGITQSLNNRPNASSGHQLAHARYTAYVTTITLHRVDIAPRSGSKNAFHFSPKSAKVPRPETDQRVSIDCARLRLTKIFCAEQPAAHNTKTR